MLSNVSTSVLSLSNRGGRYRDLLEIMMIELLKSYYLPSEGAHAQLSSQEERQTAGLSETDKNLIFCRFKTRRGE